MERLQGFLRVVLGTSSPLPGAGREEREENGHTVEC